MRKLLDHLADLWTKQINPRVSSFIAFFSIVWLAVCILATYVLAELSDEVLEREAFAIDRHILLFIHQFTSPRVRRCICWYYKPGRSKNSGAADGVYLLFFCGLSATAQKRKCLL